MNTTDEIYKLLDKLESQGNPAYKECCRLIERLEEIKDKTRKKYFISELEHVPDIECPNGIQDIYNHLYKQPPDYILKESFYCDANKYLSCIIL